MKLIYILFLMLFSNSVFAAGSKPVTTKIKPAEKIIPGGEKPTGFEKMSCAELVGGRYEDGSIKNKPDFFDRIYKVLDCSRATLNRELDKSKPEVNWRNIGGLLAYDISKKWTTDDRIKTCLKTDDILIGFQYQEMMQLLYAIRTRLTIYDQPLFSTNSNLFTPGCRPEVMNGGSFQKLRNGREDKKMKDNVLLEKLGMNTENFTQACYIRDNVRATDVKSWYLGNGRAAEYKDREICQNYIDNWLKWNENGKIKEKDPSAALRATKEPCAALKKRVDCSVVLQENFRMINAIRGCMDEVYIQCITSGSPEQRPTGTQPEQPASGTGR